MRAVSMADYFSSQLSMTTYDYLFQSTKQAFYMPLFVYEIGPLCNATRSYSFSDADCDLQGVVVREGVLRSLGFGMIYDLGFTLMSDLFSDSVRFEDFPEPSKKALQTLLDFMRNREKHETCLLKALKEEDVNLDERDIAVVISEHLLSKLSPGNVYVIDKHSQKEGNCRCGCKANIQSGDTGFGNEHVWHGFFDVVFKSHGEIVSGASTAKRVRLDLEDEDPNDNNEDQRASIPGRESDKDNAAENQFAAQAIIFSLTQKERHPNLDNYLIPFFAISASGVRIFMYDAENDILLRSQQMSIFKTDESSLAFDTVITLWMVLHYKYFCSGLDFERLSVSLENLKSGFAELIQPCIKYYKSLKSCAAAFPSVPQERKLIESNPEDWSSCCDSDYHFCINKVYIDCG